MSRKGKRGDNTPKPLHRKVLVFRCAYKTDMPGDCDGEGDFYLAEYDGELFVSLEDDLDDEEYPAGQARLFILNADAAENDGESLFDILDLRGETAALIPLIGQEAGNFSPALCKMLGEEMAFCRNMLILDRLEILPQFRGQQLGLRFIRAAIARFGMGCRIVVIKPFPLQFEGKLDDRNKDEYRKATDKLRKYYARAGIKPLRGTDLMILDLYKLRS